MTDTDTKRIRKTLLIGVAGAAKTKARSDAMFANLICRAVEAGIPQTAVAEAAGVSQAHVSRTLSANRKANEARKATRRSKKGETGGTV